MDTNALGAAIDQAVGAELRGLRSKRGLKREDLARLSGVGLRTLARFESGERSPDLHQLYALCQVLDISPRDFIGAAMIELEKDLPVTK